MDAIDQFRQAIAAQGLIPPDVIHGDGKLHRYSTDNKPSHKNGWYFLHLEGVPWGEAGDWGVNGGDPMCHWCAKSDTTMTQAERDTQRAQQKAAKEQREAELIRRHQLAATDAAQRWQVATACTQHNYLTIKGVQGYGVRMNGAGSLIIPMHDATGELCSLQTITADGEEKRFLSGGKVKGCYHSIGKKPDTVVVVGEGYATCASIHAATGHPVVVAFTAGNISDVAVAMRTKYPHLQIIIAADDDHLTNGNPGLTKATGAALAMGGLLAVPTFGANRPDKATDFNDLHALAGPSVVKACIDEALESAIRANGEVATGQMDLWSEPTPLPSSLPPVDAFDPDFLPEALRPWVMDIAHRMQCPADFPAVTALVAISSLIGARAVVQPKSRDDWRVVPNLWGAVVGRPGVKKSPALGEALKPLYRLQANEMELCKAEHEAWTLDCKVALMQGDDNERKAKGIANKDPAAARALLAPVDTAPEPVARRLIVNDATVEKLGELMNQNPWGTLSYRDELYGLLTSLDKPGQEGSRTFYLQSYDGNQGYTFDRIGRGTIHIPRVCLAMIGGIQPGRIQEYVRGAVAGGSSDDGLLQRFGLAVWPDTDGEFIHVDEWPDNSARQTAWAVFERLAALQPANDTEPVVWRFDEVAQALFVEWLVPFEKEIRGDDLHPAMVSHLSKYRKLIPALALVFALIDTPESGGIINERELVRALSMADYLRSHANRLYVAATTPETTDAAKLLIKIKAGKLVDRDCVLLDIFTPRDVAQKGWSGLATPDAVRKAADVLVDFDYLRRDVVQSSDALGRGRPSDRYLINPAVLKGGAA